MFNEKTDDKAIIEKFSAFAKSHPIIFQGGGIISHPLFTFAMIIIQGECQTITSKTSQEQIELLIEEKLKNIVEAKHLFHIMHKPYRLRFLCLSAILFSERDFSEILSECWVDVEFPNQENQSILLTLFTQANSLYMMTPEEQDTFSKLPSTLEIFRGLQNSKAKVKAFSWTLSKTKAKWFANRWGKDGEIYQANIDKKDIFLYTNQRGEQEIVINPKKLKKVKKIV